MLVRNQVPRTQWTLQRLTGPGQRAVSLEQAKANLRLSQTDTTHDSQLLDLIDAATEQVEQDTDRVLISQTFRHSLECFPSNNQPIDFSIKPIQSITSLKYIDTDGAEQTVDPAEYVLDQGRRHLLPAMGYEWPATATSYDAVYVDLVAGYGDTGGTVPRELQQAIQLQVAHWFYDPAMESDTKTAAYERIIQKLIRTSYVGG